MFEKTKINEREAWVGPFFIKTIWTKQSVANIINALPTIVIYDCSVIVCALFYLVIKTVELSVSIVEYF